MCPPSWSSGWAGLVDLTNLDDLPGDLAGVVPQAVGALSRDAFRAAAARWLAPVLYGTLDVGAFRAKPDVRTLWA